MDYCTTVYNFTKACHEGLPNKPKLMSQDEVDFATKMVKDEMEELSEASTISDQADAIVDAIYYLCDVAVRSGVNIDPIFEIVHKANMTKVVDGKVIRREDGKILKPKDWRDPGPIIEKEIVRQEANGGF